MKCAVIGSKNIYESQLEERVRQSIEQIMEEDERFEFWFASDGWFEDRCLAVLHALREERSDKRITLFCLRRRWEEEYAPMKAKQAQEYDRVVCKEMPEPQGNMGTVQKRGMIRQLIRASDAMLCCQYRGAFFEGETYLACAREAGVRIYNTVDQKMMDELIQKKMNLLTARERYVMEASYQGRTDRNIGNELGISSNRTRQIRMKVYRKIVKGMKIKEGAFADR